MTQQEIKKGNELIADFMGLESFEDSRYGKLWTNPASDGIHAKTAFDLKYQKSWDWLMPVVEKIAKMKFRVKINSNHVDTSVIIQGVEDSESVLNIMYYSRPIEAVYTAAVQFIKWYNEQSK